MVDVRTFRAMVAVWTLVFVLLLPWQAYAHTAIQRRDADFDSVRTRLDRPFVNQEPTRPQKYFHESTFHQHYDGRFADRVLKYDEKQVYLEWLMQAYLTVMNDLGVETWLMHGTLLGWYWNRKAMPWDSDVDVMLSEESLKHLASWYNMTVHRYAAMDQPFRRQYLLEVNSHWHESVIDPDNRIDARWIDMDNGLFIDITTLRRDMTAEEGGAMMMMVKDNHHYNYDDIFPLRESSFVGIPAWVPYAYAEILTEEYGNDALAAIHYENHRYDQELERWVPNATTINTDDEGLITPARSGSVS